MLAFVSKRYPEPKGRFPRVTHPCATKAEAFVRLACVRHAASVRSEPGSNSQVRYDTRAVTQASIDVVRVRGTNCPKCCPLGNSRCTDTNRLLPCSPGSTPKKPGHSPGLQSRRLRIPSHNTVSTFQRSLGNPCREPKRLFPDPCGTGRQPRAFQKVPETENTAP